MNTRLSNKDVKDQIILMFIVAMCAILEVSNDVTIHYWIVREQRNSLS